VFPLIKVDDVTHVIQLAVAPVFLLTAIGAIINVLTNRLARIVDRFRALDGEASGGPEAEALRQFERGLLARRLRLVHMALTAQVVCALMVGLTIIAAFADAYLAAKLSAYVALLFVLGMVAFIAGLVIFLREIFLAVVSTRTTLR
jgi:uncharacterized membrane protein (DUF485 family)